jgi:hypothetical protein
MVEGEGHGGINYTANLPVLQQRVNTALPCSIIIGMLGSTCDRASRILARFVEYTFQNHLSSSLRLLSLFVCVLHICRNWHTKYCTIGSVL